MKRFHVHVAVANLEDSIRFYSALFNAQPTVQKTDYAKWILEDPRLNFAISSRGTATGVDHLGIQVDSEEELVGLQHQLQAADISMVMQTGTACCYAESNKHWVTDPAGIAWESYQTLASIPTFNGGEPPAGETASTCCTPKIAVKLTPKNTCAPDSGCC